MNHDCHGDYIEDMKLYRCFVDSRFFDGLDKPPEVCPGCGRAVVEKFHKTVPNYTRVSQCVVINRFEFTVNSRIENEQAVQRAASKTEHYQSIDRTKRARADVLILPLDIKDFPKKE